MQSVVSHAQVSAKKLPAPDNMQLNPQGKPCASASDDGNVRVWDAGELKLELRGKKRRRDVSGEWKDG